MNEKKEHSWSRASGKRMVTDLVSRYTLSFEVIAAAVGCSSQSIQHWFNGTRVPQVRMRARLASLVFDCKNHGVDFALKNSHGASLRHPEVEHRRLGREGTALLDLINERPQWERLELVITLLRGMAEKELS